MGFNHADLGGRLGEHWNLPPRLSAALRWWPMPESADDADRPLVVCVSAASAAADVFSSNIAGAAVARHRDRSQQWFGLTPVESNEILGRIQSDATSILDLFELPLGQVIDTAEILAAALEEMERLALAAETDRDERGSDSEKAAS